VANSSAIYFGIALVFVAVIGYNIPISITLADTTTKLTIPQMVAFCNSGLGQFAQMSPQFVMVCSEYNNFMIGIYGAGLIGIILVIVGALYPKER